MLNEFIAFGAEKATVGAGLMSMLPMLVIWFAIFYFLLILPNKKKAKKHKEMVSSLKPGSDVITTGGIRGTVVSVNETFVVVKIAKGTDVHFEKSAISSVVAKSIETK